MVPRCLPLLVVQRRSHPQRQVGQRRRLADRARSSVHRTAGRLSV